MLLRKFLLAAMVSTAALFALPTLAQTGAAQGTSTNNSNDPTIPSAPPAMGGGAQQPASPAAAVMQTPTPSNPVSSPQPAASSGAAMVQTGGTRVHGTITDPDGYPIPGATVTMTPAKGSAKTATSGGDGTYSLGVTPGTYTVVVTMKGFASYSASSVRIPSVAATTLDAKLTIGEATQVINVEADTVRVSVDQDSNASSTVISGKDLDALSDDPDELESELTALAGPSAGPNGGQLYVDGFTGGQLPPKSSIREIRINQNPFSAQYDKLGYGRIEIFTKPGTDKFHGNFQISGDPSQFNSGTPPDQAPGLYVPPYHTIYMFGSVTGPINKWASFNLGGSHRDIEDDAYTNTYIFGLPGQVTPCVTSSGSTTGSSAGFASGCVVEQAEVSTFQPQSRTDFGPRLDLQLGSNNVLTTRFQFLQNDQVNQGISGVALPSQAYYSASNDAELQMSDTQNIHANLINETRFEYERGRSSDKPVLSGAEISVPGIFLYGGNTIGPTSDHTDHFEFQNYTSIQLKKNFVRFGGRLRSTREAQNLVNNLNGAFDYASLAAYQSNTPSQFAQTVANAKGVNFTLADLGLYAETDWKPLPNLTVSYGIRYETQNHLKGDHDWAPRGSFAYGVGKNLKQPVTVIRGGFGLFYDRFGQGDVLTLAKENGTNESVYTLQNNSVGNDIPSTCNPSNVATCLSGGASAQGQTVYSVADRLRAPYVLQLALGADQQMGKYGTLSVNFIHSLGVHALGVQDVSCNGTNPFALNNVCQNQGSFNNQYLTEGQFHENQIILTPHVQTTKWLSIFAYYALTYASGDNSGAASFLSQPGNIHADLGKTSFDVRSKYFLSGSVTLPHYMQFSPFVIGQSGNPYNITEGQDLNGDGQFNDRPYLLPSGMSATQVASLGGKTIAGCGSFLSRTTPASQVPSGVALAPINDCTGPSLFTMNFRFTKTWGFGGKAQASNTGQGSSQGGPGGPPGSSGSSGSGSHSGSHSHSGGSSSGGPSGMFGSGAGSTGQRYNVALGLMVSDLFGNKDLSTPVGTLTSPYFGQSTQLAGSPYTSTNATRRISIQASFSF